VLVTLAEEMPVSEARELHVILRRSLGLEVSRLIVNQVQPDRFPAGSPSEQVLERLIADPPSGQLDALTHHGRAALRRRRLNERYLAELSRHLTAPLLELPNLFVPRFGPTEIDELSRMIEAAS
jgi:hypothetical protein